MRDYVISIREYEIIQEILQNHIWSMQVMIGTQGQYFLGYPVFDHLAHAISFDSIEEAEEAFPNWWKNFVYGHSSYADDYDLSTLAIRKISFNTKKKLTV